MPHDPRAIDLIVVHHSASNPATTTWRTIDKWHRARGWSGIGYHRVIESDGFVMDGRPIQRQGSHAPPNANRLGICVVGWNGSEEHPDWAWSEAQWDALECELGYWTDRFSSAKVCGHRQTKATLCPGLNLYEELRARGFPMSRVVRGSV